MSVRPEIFAAASSLSGRDGELVSVHIRTEPRRVECVLDALTRLPFPTNPEIYHQAVAAYIYGDGREERRNLTIVEFPAFSDQLGMVREALSSAGISPEEAHVRSMLESIQKDHCSETAPAGAPYREIRFYRRLPAQNQ